MKKQSTSWFLASSLHLALVIIVYCTLIGAASSANQSARSWSVFPWAFTSWRCRRCLLSTRVTEENIARKWCFSLFWWTFRPCCVNHDTSDTLLCVSICVSWVKISRCIDVSMNRYTPTNKPVISLITKHIITFNILHCTLWTSKSTCGPHVGVVCPNNAASVLRNAIHM